MKKVLIKVTATIFVFLFSGIISNIYSEEWIEKTVVDKKIEINKNAKLIIDHEFGSLTCKNWDQNVISVKVIVRVKTNDVQKADKIIKNIKINVEGNENEVIATCDLNQKKFGYKQTQVSIDFEIFMPETISLELEHQFGNAYIESVSGPTSISSEYGSIEIVSLTNDNNEVEIQFSDIYIGNITKGELEISYSQLELGDAGELSIESDYSNISIDNAKLISIEAEGGRVTIGHVEELDGETSFCNFKILNLSKSLIIETNYGNLNVKNVDKDFSYIIIDNEFGAVSVGVNKGSTYNFDVDGEYCNFSYPEKLADISYRNESLGSTSIKGIIGKGASHGSKISITSEYGSVNISSR